MKLSKENLGMLLGLVGVLMFSLTLPMTRLAVRQIDPIWLALGRCAVATTLAGMTLIWFKVPFPKRPLWPKIFWTIVGVIFGFPIFSSISMRYTDVSHGAIIVGLLPLTTAAVATLSSSEKPSPKFWLTAVAGSVLVAGFALFQSEGAIQTGDIAMLGAVLTGAIGYALGGKLAQAVGGWQAISWSLVCSAPLVILAMLGFAWYRGGLVESITVNSTVNWRDISLQNWACFAYVAIFSQLVGFFFWYGGMAVGGVSRVSQVQLLQLFFTLGFAALVNQEAVSVGTWIVGLLVVMVIIINKKATVGT
jgi:drug/metabolite transporter (DMT)-like permease